uniref:Uncharacterized protein n=1 Tax=Rhizophora mucronata TaxID=61149 RepID=A0A2P2NFG9_RHIMU
MMSATQPGQERSQQLCMVILGFRSSNKHSQERLGWRGQQKLCKSHVINSPKSVYLSACV